MKEIEFREVNIYQEFIFGGQVFIKISDKSGRMKRGEKMTFEFIFTTKVSIDDKEKK